MMKQIQEYKCPMNKHNPICNECMYFTDCEKFVKKITYYHEPKMWVNYDETNICPWCKTELDPDEGCSIMYEDGSCELSCPYCGGIYWYKEEA